jgi:outer membrane protein OmpA-like peptidoglycan-associated protein
MSRVRLDITVGALALIAVCVPVPSTMAQTPANVRVVDRPARIQRWFRSPITDVLVEVEPGTTLEVLDEENGWYWVIVPRDVHGTRKSGWIRARNVERVVRAAAPTPDPGQRDERAALANASPAASAVQTATITEDKVTITVRQDETASSRTNAAAAAKTYRFDDVLFDRDRYSLRREDMDILRAAAAALKADPSLAVNIEGYTCSLGTTAYNLALGARRANAVKTYLVSEGVTADRLRTVSLGEDHAKHDNSREETRRLNRRVALVPNAQP